MSATDVGRAGIQGAGGAGAPSREVLKEAFDRSIRWLRSSGVRTEDGGLRSIYRPARDEYVTYGGGRSCLQCTAGGVLAFLEASRMARGTGGDGGEALQEAVRSAEQILGTIHDGPGGAEGAIPSGLGAASVKTLHTEAAIRSFLEVHEATGESRWLDAARSSAEWAVRSLQRADGSFRSGVGFSPYSRFRRSLVDVAPIGAAAYIGTLRRVARLTGNAGLDGAAGKLMAWLRNQQDDEGGFPMYRYRTLSRSIAAFFHGGTAELLRGCLRYHPSPNAWMIEAFLEEGDEAAARRVTGWLLPRIGPNGLLYQYYFPGGVGKGARGAGAAHAGGVVTEPYGGRSVEEDVMPTTSLALQWMRKPSLLAGKAETILERIAAGVVYAQVRSGDRRLDGGIRGLPLHPAFGDDIYTWDTAYGAIFLARYMEWRGAGSG